MDARSFGNFLVSEFEKVAKSVEGNLLSMAFQDMGGAHRASASRDILMQVVNTMPAYLDKFYQNGGNSVPQPSNTVISDTSVSEGQ